MSSVSAAILWLRDSIPHQRVPLLRGQATALACIAVASLSRWPLAPFVEDSVPFITFFPAVLVASVWGGTRAGVSALTLSLIVAGSTWVTPDGDLRVRVLAWSSLAAFALFGGLLVLVSVLLRGALNELASSNERSRLLAEEMKHRVKNILAMAAAVSRQSARGAGSVGEYQALLEGRLTALAAAQELAALNPLRPTQLRQLLHDALKPFDYGQISWTGPTAEVSQQLTPMFALLMHELATNATKYGALSVPTGRVQVRWLRNQGAIDLEWMESGGPLVREPERTGFGSRLVRSAFQTTQATVALEYRPEGVLCRVSFEAEPGENIESASLDARMSEA